MAKNMQNSDNGPTLYRCSQGLMFVKRSEEPASTKITRLKKPIGSYVYSTGRLWKGPSGGTWTELDAAKGEMGWALVEGPGFGIAREALVDATRSGVLKLEVVLLDVQACMVFESLITKDVTTRDVKKMVCQKTGLEVGFCCLGKDPPMNPQSGDTISIDYMPSLDDEKTVSSYGFVETAMLFLIYIGEYPPDFMKPPPIQISLQDLVQPQPGAARALAH